MMRYWLKIVSGILVLVLITAGIAGILLFQASQSVPDFYEQALNQDSAESIVAGEQFERSVLSLTNDLQTHTHWQATFTADEINGWLTADLPAQFPGVLPRSVREPRVALDEGEAQLACRVESKRLSAIVSFDLAIFLTENPNELAIRVNGARAGSVPVPIKDFLNKVTNAARRAKLQIHWTHDGGVPTALVKIPSHHKDLKRGVLVESLELRPGELFLAGRSEEPEDSQLGNFRDKSSIVASR